MSAPGLYATDRKTAGELKVIAEQRGWKPKKELTLADVQRMGSLEMQFHELFSPEAMKLAIEEPARKAKAAKQRVKDMWDGKLPELDSAARKAVETFCEKYPQFIRDEPNALALCNFTKLNGLDGTLIESYETAFQALAARGELHLNPSALGLGTEERISGHSVKTHPELHLLLRPALTSDQLDKYKSAKMSSAEYLKAHPELTRPTKLPDYVTERISRAYATFKSMEPSFVATDDSIDALIAWMNERGYPYSHNSLLEGFKTLYEQGKIGRRRDAVVHGQVVTMTEYPLEQRTPPVSDKYSFQKTIDSMGSQEYLDRINKDPQFRAAIDSL